MKKIFLAFIISSLFFVGISLPINAQTSAPTSDQEETEETSDNLDQNQEASDSTTQKLKERIEKIVEEKKQQIQGAISDLSYRKRGFIGEIQRVTEETLTVKNEKGTQIIPLEENLRLLKKDKIIATDEIAVGDWVTILGLIEDDTFAPKRVYVSTHSLLPNTHFIMLGTVEEISSKSLTFKSRAQENSQDFVLNTKTNFQDNEGEETFLKNFDKNMQALLIGYEDDDKKVVTVLRALATFEKE